MGCLNNSRHLARKYARTFVRGHYLIQEEKSVLRAKTVSFEEQIMSVDKYPSKMSQMATVVYIILQIFFAKRAIFKIG